MCIDVQGQLFIDSEHPLFDLQLRYARDYKLLKFESYIFYFKDSFPVMRFGNDFPDIQFKFLQIIRRYASEDVDR
jgi:hypothetical protein